MGKQEYAPCISIKKRQAGGIMSMILGVLLILFIQFSRMQTDCILEIGIVENIMGAVLDVLNSEHT